MNDPERLYVTEKMDDVERTEYIRGDIIETIRQERRDAVAEVEQLQHKEAALLAAFEAKANEMKDEANNMVLQLPTAEGRYQAAYVRDGVTATVDTLFRYLKEAAKAAGGDGGQNHNHD